MSAQPAFDTAEYEQTLIESGVEPRQARAHRAALSLVLQQATSELATRRQVEEVEHRLNAKFADVNARFDKQSADINTRFEKQSADINAMGLRFSEALRMQTFAMLGGVAAIVGLATALIKLTP